MVTTEELSEEALRATLAIAAQEPTVCVCFCASLLDGLREAVEEELDLPDGRLEIIPWTCHPIWRELFQDVAIPTGARVLRAGEIPVLEDLGRAQGIAIEEGTLVITGGAGSPGSVTEHLRNLEQLARTASELDFSHLSLRRAFLHGGHAVIRVCGKTAGETEPLDRDTCHALHSARSLVATGGVPGGGVAYLLAAETLGEMKIHDADTALALRALAEGLQAPVRCFIEQAGLPIDATLDLLREDRGLCLDTTAPTPVRWPQAGPIDAAGIVRFVIEAAGEAAARIIRRTASPG
jgi:chaperonin GroEL